MDPRELREVIVNSITVSRWKGKCQVLTRTDLIWKKVEIYLIPTAKVSMPDLRTYMLRGVPTEVEKLKLEIFKNCPKIDVKIDDSPTYAFIVTVCLSFALREINGLFILTNQSVEFLLFDCFLSDEFVG